MDNSQGDIRTKSLTGNGQVLVDANPDRLSITIGSDGTADISVSTDPSATHPSGLLIVAKSAPQTFSRELNGGWIVKKLFVSVSAGTAVISIAESLDTHTQQRQTQ